LRPNRRREVEAALKGGERVGSVTTDASGNFAFSYGDDDIAALKREKDRLDLVVTIAAPDDEKAESSKRVIYSSEPRIKAGKVENFNVGISPTALKKFGLDGGTDIKSTIDEYKQGEVLVAGSIFLLGEVLPAL
jgi:hypothetical protein